MTLHRDVKSFTVGVKHVAKRRLESWLKYFAPFVITWIFMFVLDVTATAFYGVDFGRATVSFLCPPL